MPLERDSLGKTIKNFNVYYEKRHTHLLSFIIVFIV